MKHMLMSPPMVRATLDLRKEVTRRELRLPKRAEGCTVVHVDDGYNRALSTNAPRGFYVTDNEGESHLLQPKYQPGEVVYVGEAFRLPVGFDDLTPLEVVARFDGALPPIWYAEDPQPPGGWIWGRLRQGQFLPEALARTFLRITGVRVERLQAISEEDAVAEGVEKVSVPLSRDAWKCYISEGSYHDPRKSYFTLWQSINGVESFMANPWVWRYGYEVLSTTGRNAAVEAAVAAWKGGARG